MRLSHWSTDPITEVYSVNPVHDQRRDKPRGLWVSVDGEDDWQAWCETEQWGDLPSKIRHEVVLAPDANLLHLTTSTEVNEFTNSFGIVEAPLRGMVSAIDWAKVGAQWQGIIIAPYQWDLRLATNTSWYYGWDCASGCIWDADAVAEIRPWQPAEVVTEAVT